MRLSNKYQCPNGRCAAPCSCYRIHEKGECATTDNGRLDSCPKCVNLPILGIANEGDKTINELIAQWLQEYDRRKVEDGFRTYPDEAQDLLDTILPKGLPEAMTIVEELKRKAIWVVMKNSDPEDDTYATTILALPEVHAYFKALYSQSVLETTEHTDMMVICPRWRECPYHECTCFHREKHHREGGCTQPQMAPCPACAPVATETKRVCSCAHLRDFPDCAEECGLDQCEYGNAINVPVKEKKQ